MEKLRKIHPIFLLGIALIFCFPGLKSIYARKIRKNVKILINDYVVGQKNFVLLNKDDFCTVTAQNSNDITFNVKTTLEVDGAKIRDYGISGVHLITAKSDSSPLERFFIESCEKEKSIGTIHIHGENPEIDMEIKFIAICN